MSGMKWALGWSSLWELCEGILERVSPAGDPEGYAGKALEMGIFPIGAPFRGTWRRSRLPGAWRVR
jgi:hypothetical protein